MRTDSKWVDRRHLTWAPDDAGTIFAVVNILNPLMLHAFAAFIFSLLEIVREITESSMLYYARYPFTPES
ncbi:hypothetical protein NMY22_g2319 [Coprinellus aureogranulatus]|nr:hypothetical protein NMY22_g2319 [Coprinellus aureogranulatus]